MKTSPNLSRRAALTAGAAAPVALFAPSIVSARTLGGGPLGQGIKPLANGSMTTTSFKNVTVHSYQSPDLTGCVTTHIVETPERLVVIDGQRSVIYGQEIKDYAETLGKPVDRMIISHLHPDHWFGAYQFSDVPIYSFAETQGEIEQLGDFFIEISKPSLGEHVPPEKVVPNKTVAHNSREVIDGVTFEYRYVQDAESDNMMAVFLPEQKLLIAQDMLYNNCHLFCGHGNFDGWIGNLKELRKDTSYDIVLPGHGANEGSRQAIDDAIIYLGFVKEQFANANDGGSLKAAILEQYPSYMAAGLVDIQNLFLFPEK